MGEKTIDVKTQINKYSPNEGWRCEVTTEQFDKHVDAFVFAKMVRNGTQDKVGLVGWSPSDEFRGLAISHVAGTILDGRRVHYSKYDVEIRQLRPMADLLAWL